MLKIDTVDQFSACLHNFQPDKLHKNVLHFVTFAPLGKKRNAQLKAFLQGRKRRGERDMWERLVVKWALGVLMSRYWRPKSSALDDIWHSRFLATKLEYAYMQVRASRCINTRREPGVKFSPSTAARRHLPIYSERQSRLLEYLWFHLSAESSRNTRYTCQRQSRALLGTLPHWGHLRTLQTRRSRYRAGQRTPKNNRISVLTSRCLFFLFTALRKSARGISRASGFDSFPLCVWMIAFLIDYLMGLNGWQDFRMWSPEMFSSCTVVVLYLESAWWLFKLTDGVFSTNWKWLFLNQVLASSKKFVLVQCWFLLEEIMQNHLLKNVGLNCRIKKNQKWGYIQKNCLCVRRRQYIRKTCS